VKVGIIGAGWVTQYHLPAWSKLDGVAVAAICDPDPAARQARMDGFGIARGYADAEAMLAREDLDIVDIASPRRFHAEHVRLAARNGVATLCQKPLGVDLEQAETLVGEISDSVRLMVHENWRFRPYYRELKNWLDEGVTGDIVSARLDFFSSGMIPDATGQRPALVRQPFFRSEQRLLVMEVLIHHLDSLRFLLGEFDLINARLRRSTTEIIGEDSAMLTLVRRADGMPLSVSGNLAVHGAPPAPRDQLWIHGKDGTIHLDGSRLQLLGPEPRDVTFEPQDSYQAAYDAAIAHFVTCLKTGQTFETAPADNLETLRLVERAYDRGAFQDLSEIC
jgi:D-apiose dehydrogenase